MDEITLMDTTAEMDGSEPRDQFTALLTRHHVQFMSYILSMIPRWADAEDVLQQSSVVMWRKFGEFQPGTNFVAWGCQIAKFHVLNHLRKLGRERQVFSAELVEALANEGVADADRLNAERQALQGCIEKLDPKCRALLGNCYDADASIKDVAGKLGRSPNSLYKGLNRIREVLLRCIEKTLAQEGF